MVPAVLDRMDESPSLETMSLKLGLIDFQKAALYIMYHVPDFMENSQYDKLLQKSTHFRGGKKKGNVHRMRIFLACNGQSWLVFNPCG